MKKRCKSPRFVNLGPGLTQKEVAAIFGVSSAAINKVEQIARRKIRAALLADPVVLAMASEAGFLVPNAFLSGENYEH